VFVGGYHNTCNETVTFFDLDRIPESHRQEFAAARKAIDATCERNAHERCRRFMSAPLTMSFSAARQHVEERSEDLAQTRPELGHATNAITIVGRREWTRGLYLDRRAFLTSYDPTQDDAESTILTRLLQAVYPVCSGINLEYYFSNVDNAGFGAGTKLPHNLASLLGVMDGAASDLRTGLPWQMVEIHEPVRSLFIIETTPEAMLRIIERNEMIGRISRNGWVQLAVLDPESRAISVFQDNAFRPYQPQATVIPKAASSVDWYPRLARPPGVRRDRKPSACFGELLTETKIRSRSEHKNVLMFLGLVIVGFPLLLTIILGISSLLDWKLTEETTSKLVYAAIVSGLLAAVAVLVSMLWQGTRHIAIDPGRLGGVVIPHHFHFSVKFIFDRLSVPFAILSFVLSGTIGAFASKYMHRERGFNRFFVLYAIFVLGMEVTSLAGTIETLFTGWELVGLSSALLVAFFQERPAPARNGLWVWTVYRVSDAGLLLAAVAMHHLRGEGDFDKLLGTGSWPDEHSSVSLAPGPAGGAALAGARRREIGPGAVLGLAAPGDGRTDAVERRVLWRAVGAPGCLPAAAGEPAPEPIGAGLRRDSGAGACPPRWFAYLAGSVQTDIKSALSFASLSQVGIIVAEIGVADSCSAASSAFSGQAATILAGTGVGLRYVALFHILGHACLRTLQFVRAPTLLQDYRTLENAIGANLPRAGGPVAPPGHG